MQNCPSIAEDLRSRSERRRGWWIETRATVPCILPQDGTLTVFRLTDVESTLDANYPHHIEPNRKVWYFNSSRDREIAESDGPRVYANPRVLWTHFLPKE